MGGANASRVSQVHEHLHVVEGYLQACAGARIAN